MGKQTFRFEKILRQAFFCRDQSFSVGFDKFCGIIMNSVALFINIYYL